MTRCECGFTARTKAGLAVHQKAAHGESHASNRKALERTLTILRKLGRIEDIDAATVQTIRSLADALDVDPSNAQMWKVYREALNDLMEQDEHADDDLEKALAALRSTAPLVHPKAT